MTIRIFADKTVQFFPVQFTLYKLAKKDIVVVDDDGHPRTIAKQGQPDPSSFHDGILLYRDVTKGETVKDTIKRFQKMLQDSTTRFSVTWQPETDQEREERYRENFLEVVSEGNEDTSYHLASTHEPPKPVDDEQVGITLDTGKIKPKRVKADKKLANAA